MFIEEIISQIAVPSTVKDLWRLALILRLRAIIPVLEPALDLLALPHGLGKSL